MKKEMTEVRHHDNSAGIVGIVFGVLSVLSGVPGILLGLIGFFFSLNQHKKAKNKWSQWGLVLNIVGFALGIILAIYVAMFVSSSVAGLQGLSGLEAYG